MATRTKAADIEPDEEEFDEMPEEDEDLEELEDEEPEEKPAPKKRTTSKAAPAKATAAEPPVKGSAWLAAHVTEVTGETFDSRAVRMLLRKLAKDGALARVVGETRDRYAFTGPTDPIVKAVVTMIKDGTAKAMKQDGLAKLKEQGEAKKAAAKAAKAKEPEPEDDEDEEFEEVEEEAPKPRTRRAPAKAATPAKATPAKATTRRRASTTA